MPPVAMILDTGAATIAFPPAIFAALNSSLTTALATVTTRTQEVG